jgi:hypothetical protein
VFADSSPLRYHQQLINPRRQEVLDALSEASRAADDARRESGWHGGQVDFAFAGHGTPAGGLCVTDAEVNAQDLVDAVLAARTSSEQRYLSLVLDACYSARVLCEVLADERHSTDLLLIDGFAASLHDEAAWELERLGHGALTFAMRNRGNRHVDRGRFARAVKTNDEAFLRFALQAFTPNPVTYLTEGEQNSVEVLNGHGLSVQGSGRIEVLSRPKPDDLFEALERARDADDGELVAQFE